MQVRYVAVSCLVTLAVVFTVSAFSKLRGRSAYGAFVAATGRLVPVGWLPAGPVAALVLGAELAVPLLLPVLPVAGLALAAALLVVFCIGILRALHHGVRASCRCFGASGAPLGRRHAGRAGALAALALVGAVAAGRASGPDLIAGARPEAVALAVLAAAVLALLTLTFDDLVHLFAPGPVPARSVTVPKGSTNARAGRRDRAPRTAHPG
ncbi:MauE/DoxX family redox-associated membrane protein [Micromonospora costi]|uniref:MauE/DoxX family redox-associated membrane protein n=1 Tax=Micromonospora costi TaxID=1530042 RepID=UPI0033E53C44